MSPRLRVRAISGRKWSAATTQSAGVKPLTCPPASSIHLADFADTDLLYLNLHGLHDHPILYGQGEEGHRPLAISRESFSPFRNQALRFQGTIVFAEVCYLANPARGNRKLVHYFLSAGCSAVVAPVEQAYGRIRPVKLLDGEADRLGYFFRWGLRLNPGKPRHALDFAKRVLQLFSLPLDREDQETLEQFVVLRKGKGT